SPGTVDRVIHNRGEVSEETRKKVDKIVQELDYKPDILARTLASKKSYLFAVLMPVSVNGSDFWQAPNMGIDKAFEEISPFGITIHRYYFDQLDKDAFLRQAEAVKNDKPDAVLFAPIFPDESREFVNTCVAAGINVALFNSNIDGLDRVYYIGQDALQSGYLGARMLTYGIHNEGDILLISLAGRKENHNDIIRRERGFRRYLAENARNGFSIINIEMSLPSGDELSEKLRPYFEKSRVRGVFVANSRVHQLAAYFEQNKIRNVRLIGYDLLPENVAYLKKGVIDFLISQKPEEQGYRGVMTLFNMIILKREVEQVQYIPIDILTRENIEYYKY
ncbi:MAG TPA: LacI family DNA-binding transcriptional regulator, partial [Bacteroidales bacterium]|nr:LacI family DNA-binding transcriptional regulator [Bacteroidales bacterium]